MVLCFISKRGQILRNARIFSPKTPPILLFFKQKLANMMLSPARLKKCQNNYCLKGGINKHEPQNGRSLIRI